MDYLYGIFEKNHKHFTIIYVIKQNYNDDNNINYSKQILNDIFSKSNITALYNKKVKLKQYCNLTINDIIYNCILLISNSILINTICTKKICSKLKYKYCKFYNKDCNLCFDSCKNCDDLTAIAINDILSYIFYNRLSITLFSNDKYTKNEDQLSDSHKIKYNISFIYYNTNMIHDITNDIYTNLYYFGKKYIESTFSKEFADSIPGNKTVNSTFGKNIYNFSNKIINSVLLFDICFRLKDINIYHAGCKNVELPIINKEYRKNAFYEGCIFGKYIIKAYASNKNINNIIINKKNSNIFFNDIIYITYFDEGIKYAVYIFKKLIKYAPK